MLQPLFIMLNVNESNKKIRFVECACKVKVSALRAWSSSVQKNLSSELLVRLDFRMHLYSKVDQV